MRKVQNAERSAEHPRIQQGISFCCFKIIITPPPIQGWDINYPCSSR